MDKKKDSFQSSGFFSVQDIIEGIYSTEAMTDTIIAQGAKVICTAAGTCQSESRMIKGASCLLLQKSVELGHKDVEFSPPFPACTVGDHVCKPEIERKEWQDYDESKVTSTGEYSLLKDKSYMLCTKGFGIIYASDNGQKIDQRQAQSKALLFQRWKDNPEEMGFLKGALDCCAYSTDPVNLNTGNFIYEHEDLSIIGVMPLTFKRFYNAMDTRSGSLGEGWIHNYEMHLKIKKNKLLLFLEDGKEEQYRLVSKDLYRNVHTGIETIKMVRTGTQIIYLYTTVDQNCHTFDENGKELNREDANGNRIELAYNSEGHLVLVKTDSAYFDFYYDENGRLEGVRDHTGRETGFQYESASLQQVTDPMGNVITYSYGSNGKIQAITNPRGIETVSNEYDQYLRTTKQSFPDGGQVLYTYDDDNKIVEMIQQNGNCVRHYYDEKYRNVKTVYEDGQEVFTYNEQNKKIRHKGKRGYLTKFEYDRQGNETKHIDPLQNRTHKTYNQQNKLLTLSVNGSLKVKNQYDKKNNLQKSTDGLDRSREFVYNQQGLVTQLVQPDGGSYFFQYDSTGNLSAITDPMGYQISYQYDSLKRIISTIDANGYTQCYQYDNSHNLIKVTNAEHKEQTYTYNSSNKVTSFTDYDGNTIYQEYGVLNKPSRIIDALGNETVLEYDLMWNLCKVTDANQGVTQYTYNKANLLESATNPIGGTINYEYDADGNRTKVIDPNGLVTELTYDALNQVTRITEPDGSVQSYEYNGEGQVTKSIDSLGQTIYYEYDGAGQKVKEINVLGEETKYTYNQLSKLITVNKDGYELVRYEYDSRGLLTAEYHLNGKNLSYEYDGNQNLIHKIEQNGHIQSYEYDSSDRVIEVSDNRGQIRQYAYDGVGNLNELIDGNGNITKYIHDPCGNLIGVIDPSGNQTAYGYDKIGNLTHIIQGESPIFTCESRTFDLEEVLKLNQKKQGFCITTYEWDKAGRMGKTTDPMGNTEHYSYDPVGNLTSKLDRDGYLTNYDYNTAGDLSRVGYGDGKEVKLSYNPLRQLVQFEDWLGITRIENDALGRTVTVTDYRDKEVSYNWGTLNQRTKVTYPDGQSVLYGYDELLHLKEVKGMDSSVDYAYDKQGNLREKAFRNGMKTTYRYNGQGQLENLCHWDHRRKTDDYSYVYDRMGNIVEINKQRDGMKKDCGTYQYQYDSLNRLNQVIKDGYLQRSYQYDKYGNRVRMETETHSSCYSYNVLNQLVKKVDGWIDSRQSDGIPILEETYKYDQRGNLTDVYRDGQRINQYFFGALNRLESAMNYQNGHGADYLYNGLGNRVGKSEGTPIEPILPNCRLSDIKLTPTKQIEDVLDLTKQYHNLLTRSENDQIKSFIWDSNVLSATGGDGTYHYLQDHLGSPIRVADDEGRIQQSYAYDEFGQDLYHVQEVNQPFGYTGYQRDGTTNTYFAQSREYSAQAGTFISRDKEKYYHTAKPNTWNLYHYCWQNPMKYTDAAGFDLEATHPLKPIANAPVQMTVTGNTIKIDVYVDFKGDQSLATQNGTSCKDLATAGIKDWAGDYQAVYGENVKIDVQVHERSNTDSKKQKYVNLHLESKKGIPHMSYGMGWNNEKTKTIKMYRQDKRGTNPYSDNSYQWTVAHEMGHVFGLDDAYGAEESLLQKIFGGKPRPDSKAIVGENGIMRYQFNGINIGSKDIEMMILAYETGKFQSYADYQGHKKSECIN